MSSGKKYRIVTVIPAGAPYFLEVPRRIDLDGKIYEERSDPEARRQAIADEYQEDLSPQAQRAEIEVLLGYFTWDDCTRVINKITNDDNWWCSSHFDREVWEETCCIEFSNYNLTREDHQRMLRASVGYVSKERKSRLSRVMRLLEDHDRFLRVVDSNGHLLQYVIESEFMMHSSGYEFDGAKGIITFRYFSIDDKERRKYLDACLKNTNLPNKLADELRRESERIKRKMEDEEKRKAINWRRVFQGVKQRLEEGSHDYKSTASVLQLIRRQFDRKTGDNLVVSVTAAMNRLKLKTIELDGTPLSPAVFVDRVCKGDNRAISVLADLLVTDAERRAPKVVNTPSPRKETTPENKQDDLPDWAKPERAFILEWADRTLEKDPASLVEDIAHFIAKRVKRGGVNVLVFDAELYAEVTGAEIKGKGTGKIEEFPFPLTVVRMQGEPGVYGVAVFRRQDFRRAAVTEVGRTGRYADGYEVAYVLDGGGVTLDPSPRTASVGERLTTYLDCDNAMIETAYVDGGSTGRQNSPRPKDKTHEYVRGADYDVGVRVVVERERRHGGAKVIEKRAHFRRGFYKRQRVGPRDAWHYETKWIRPTFVHGSKTIVTERRVKRLVL